MHRKRQAVKTILAQLHVKKRAEFQEASALRLRPPVPHGDGDDPLERLRGQVRGDRQVRGPGLSGKGVRVHGQCQPRHHRQLQAQHPLQPLAV